MKEIKQFAVRSDSFALLTAFKEECEAMGWVYDEKFNPFTKESHVSEKFAQRPLFFSTQLPSTEKPGFTLSCTSETPYVLPEQWNEAIEMAKKTIKTIGLTNIVFRLNDNVYAQLNKLKKLVQVVYNEFPSRIESYEFSYEQFGILYDRLKEYQEDSKSVPFTKSMLRSGMLVQNASGKLGLVMLGTESGDVIAGYGPKDDSKFTWGWLGYFKEDLTHPDGGGDNDIVIVWSGEKLSNRGRARIDTEGRHKIWSRAGGNRSFFIHGANLLHHAVNHNVLEVVLSRDSVKVGCQTFSHTAIENLHKEISKTK